MEGCPAFAEFDLLGREYRRIGSARARIVKAHRALDRRRARSPAPASASLATSRKPSCGGSAIRIAGSTPRSSRRMRRSGRPGDRVSLPLGLRSCRCLWSAPAPSASRRPGGGACRARRGRRRGGEPSAPAPARATPRSSTPASNIHRSAARRHCAPFVVAARRLVRCGTASRDRRTGGKLIVQGRFENRPKARAARRPGVRNGVDDLRMLEGAEAMRMEPEPVCTAAFHSPEPGSSTATASW